MNILEVSLSKFESFIEWEKQQKKVTRGGLIYYDIPDHHMYLTFSQLFYWYIAHV